MTVVTDNPVHLNGLPNSTTLLEALLTDLAVEVGVLAGPVGIFPLAHEGICLARFCLP